MSPVGETHTWRVWFRVETIRIAQIPILELSLCFRLSPSVHPFLLLLLSNDVSHNVYVVATWHGLTAFTRPRHSFLLCMRAFLHLLRSYVARDNISVTHVRAQSFVISRQVIRIRIWRSHVKTRFISRTTQAISHNFIPMLCVFDIYQHTGILDLDLSLNFVHER